MGIRFKSLSGLYTGTKSLFKIGETSLPKFIQAPERAINVELFNISKGGIHFKDMYVFRDKSGDIVRKYIVRPKVKINHGDNLSLFDVDKFDYGRNGMDVLANGNKTRGVDTTIERIRTRQNVTENLSYPFDYTTGRTIVEKPETHTFVRDIGIERTVTSRISDRGTGFNPVVSKTVFNQSLDEGIVKETSEIAEYTKGSAPKWFKFSREYMPPKGTHKKVLYDLGNMDGILDSNFTVNPISTTITASRGIPTKTDDPYLFLRLHTNKQQFCLEAEPIIARKVGFKDTRPTLEYYRNNTNGIPEHIEEEILAYGRTPKVKFAPKRHDCNGFVDPEVMVRPFFNGGNSNFCILTIADAISNPFTKHTGRVHTLAHESQHLLDGRRMMLAQMPIGNNVRIENGSMVWEELALGNARCSISPQAVGVMGGWIKPTKPEYAEIIKLREAYLRYGVDKKTTQGYENNFLEINANRKAKEIVEDYEKTFDIHKFFPNLTKWQLG